jgi:hypothetical protein
LAILGLLVFVALYFGVGFLTGDSSDDREIHGHVDHHVHAPHQERKADDTDRRPDAEVPPAEPRPAAEPHQVEARPIVVP